MTRQEMYDYIRKNDMADVIKDTEGKNFTNCSNKILKMHIDAYADACCRTIINDLSDNNKVDKLIKILEKKHILLKSEVDYING